MVGNNLTAALKSAVRARALIRVERPFDRYRLAGYAVGLGSWLLLHLLNTDVMALNGYTAVRTDDVRRIVEGAEEDGGFLVHAASLRKLRPKVPKKISVEGTTALLQTVAQRFPLVTLHRERSKGDSGVCWIGALETVTETYLKMREITPAA